jgi:zinc protease
LQKLSERINLTRFPANIFRLENGLTVVHQYLAATPVTVADVWVRAGTAYEPETWSGMAHFLEHSIFKGSRRIAPGEFDRLIECSGGVANAATSHDYAHYFLTTAAQYLPDTLPLLADILIDAAIPDEEFLRERDVVLEEIRSSYDDPDWIAFQTLCQSLYQYHPYKRSILGEEELLLNHSPNQMRCFHRTYYQPQNMTVTIVGGIEQEAALSLVNDCFSDFNAPSECPPAIVEAEPPIIEIRRNELYLPRIEQARLSMGWLGAGVEQLRDAIGLDMLSVILASSRSSRLVRELREEKQLVLDICSTFSLQRDSSLFTVNAWLETQYLDLIEKIISEHIFALQTTNVTEVELARTKRLLINDYIFSTETPGQLAGVYGYYNTLATAELAVAYPSIIEELQAIDLQKIARQYLSPEHYAISVLKPC